MELDPSKRITAHELLHHPWVQGKTAKTEKIADSDKKLCKDQDLRYKLEASVFAVLVNQGHLGLSMSQARRPTSGGNRTGGNRTGGGLPILKAVFDVFDEDGKGYVTGEDIRKVVTEHTSEVLKTKDTDEFLKLDGKDSGETFSFFSKLFSGPRHKQFPCGHCIFHAWDEGSSMCFLNSGKVKIQTREGQLIAFL
jgi:hypothetical protein